MDSQTINVDITTQGTESGYVEAPFSHLETNETIQGSISTSSSSISVNQRAWYSLMQNGTIDQITQNRILENTSSATMGGSTYQFQDGYVRWESNSLTQTGVINVVREPDYWQDAGTLWKDGQLFGEVHFNGPVVADTHGPELYLYLATGEEIFLHTLIQYP